MHTLLNVGDDYEIQCVPGYFSPKAPKIMWTFKSQNARMVTGVENILKNKKQMVSTLKNILIMKTLSI